MFSILEYVPNAKHKGGGEYAAPCPACGGTDRFLVWPDRPRGGAYLCRQCGVKGDGIQFARDFLGMSFADAADACGVPTSPNRGKYTASKAAPSVLRPRPATTTAQPKPVTPPPALWQEQAAAFLAECQDCLETSTAAVEHIALGRNICPTAARAYGIGWNDCDRYIERSAWGLPPSAQGKGKMVLPRGIVIATRRRIGVAALTIRTTATDRPKYWQCAGSSNVPFVLGQGSKPVVLLESALDAALLMQEADGRVDAVGLNGNCKGLDADTAAFVRAAPLVLACPDNDDGGRVALSNWRRYFPNAIYTPPWGAKDLGDMHKAALTITADGSELNTPTVGEWLTVALALALNTQRSAQGSA